MSDFDYSAVLEILSFGYKKFLRVIAVVQISRAIKDISTKVILLQFSVVYFIVLMCLNF